MHGIHDAQLFLRVQLFQLLEQLLLPPLQGCPEALKCLLDLGLGGVPLGLELLQPLAHALHRVLAGAHLGAALGRLGLQLRPLAGSGLRRPLPAVVRLLVVAQRALVADGHLAGVAVVLEHLAGMQGAAQRPVAHLVWPWGPAQLVKGEHLVALKAAHVAVSRHAVVAQEGGAVRAAGHRCLLRLA
uniref:Putative secreted protein n=1 Tax=Ixodes ricinus TaxID=34613 RepID=A0A147BAE9_IXORI